MIQTIETSIVLLPGAHHISEVPRAEVWIQVRRKLKPRHDHKRTSGIGRGTGGSRGWGVGGVTSPPRHSSRVEHMLLTHVNLHTFKQMVYFLIGENIQRERPRPLKGYLLPHGRGSDFIYKHMLQYLMGEDSVTYPNICYLMGENQIRNTHNTKHTNQQTSNMQRNTNIKAHTSAYNMYIDAYTRI